MTFRKYKKAGVIPGFFFIALFCLTTFAAQAQVDPQVLTRNYQASMAPFYHGVASGDPLHDRVILWTRVSPRQHRQVQVQWAIATDATMKRVVQQGIVTTDSTRDYTVKVDATGLKPGKKYYYQFQAMGGKSMVGTTKTADTNPKSLRFGFVSCSNYQAGFFHAYGLLAEQEELDAVVHLGDYIYEYPAKVYGDTALHRFHVPAHEVISVQDYRQRYNQYHLDSNLVKLRAKYPMINIWDDHEIANNANREGAANHNPNEEGTYEQRKKSAKTAFFEWLPVREQEGEHLYRAFDFGNLVQLIVLDERLERDRPPRNIDKPRYHDSTRTMLGYKQRDWLLAKLKQPYRWQVIGNQVVFGGVNIAFQKPDRPKYMDMWDGYPFEKQRIIRQLRDSASAQVLFVTGDFHSSVALDVTEDYLDKAKYDGESGKGAIASEWVVPSITAANYDYYMPVAKAEEIAKIHQLPQYNPHIRYMDLTKHGFVVLQINKKEAVGQYFYIEDLAKPAAGGKAGPALKVKYGEAHMQLLK